MKYGCIYKITNTVNGKLYIGQTTAKNPNTRWMNHKQHAKHNYKNSCRKLVNSMKCHGIDKFTFEIMMYAKDKVELDSMEIRFIKELDTILNGYNLSMGGANGKASDETKRRMSEAQKRIGNKPPCTPESIAKMAASKRGKPGPNKKGVLRYMKNSRPCIVDGFLYPSINAAAKILNMKKQTLRSYLNRDRSPKIECEYLIGEQNGN